MIDKDRINKYCPWFVFQPETYLMTKYCCGLLKKIIFEGNINYISKKRRSNKENNIILMSLHSYSDLYNICATELKKLRMKKLDDTTHLQMITRDVAQNNHAKTIRNWELNIHAKTEEQASVWESFQSRYGVMGNLEDGKLFSELGDLLDDYVNSIHYTSDDNNLNNDLLFATQKNKINALGPFLMIHGHQHMIKENFPQTANDIAIIPQLPLKCVANARLGLKLEVWDIFMFALLADRTWTEMDERLKIINIRFWVFSFFFWIVGFSCCIFLGFCFFVFFNNTMWLVCAY